IVAQDVLSLVKDERSRNAVKIAHLYLHGEATIEELNTAAADAVAVAAAYAIYTAADVYAASDAAAAAYAAYTAAVYADDDDARKRQAEHLIAITENFEGWMYE
ncbi:MAG: hypothetical protein GY816_23390, partial [Cytophagales bacterium]|nr:hypothetical protein [Cytophagales bacterium]